MITNQSFCGNGDFQSLQDNARTGFSFDSKVINWAFKLYIIYLRIPWERGKWEIQTKRTTENICRNVEIRFGCLPFRLMHIAYVRNKNDNDEYMITKYSKIILEKQMKTSKNSYCA